MASTNYPLKIKFIDNFLIVFTFFLLLLFFRTRKVRKRTLKLFLRIFENSHFFRNFEANSIFQSGRMLRMKYSFWCQKIFPNGSRKKFCCQSLYFYVIYQKKVLLISSQGATTAKITIF